MIETLATQPLRALVPFHVIAGLVGIASGFVALYAAKGKNTHRKSGLIFVFAMLTMAGTAAVMASTIDLNRINIIAGVLTFYLVVTGFLTVRRTVPGIHWLEPAAMLFALAVATAGISWGVTAGNSGNGELDGMPASGFFMFGIVASLAALGDLRLIRARGIQGKRRIARHLWRMGLALFIAAGSFFWGQADEFPEQLRNTALLSIPPLAVVLTTLYWVLRVQFTPTHFKNGNATTILVEISRNSDI